MTVHKVTAAGSNNVAPLVTLVAAADDAQVVFATAVSTFNALAAQGDNGVLVQVDLSSVAEALSGGTGVQPAVRPRKAPRAKSMFGEPVVLMLMSLLGLALFVILVLVLNLAGQAT